MRLLRRLSGSALFSRFLSGRLLGGGRLLGFGGASRVQRSLHELAGLKDDGVVLFDVNFLAGAGIVRFSRGSRLDAKDAKAAEFNATVLDEQLGDCVKGRLNRRLRVDKTELSRGIHVSSNFFLSHW